MVGGAEDSLFECLGSISAAVSSVFWWCAACIEVLLAVVDFVGRTASVVLTVAYVILGYLLAVAAVLKEFVVDVGLLVADLVKLAAFLLVSAFSCAQTVAHVLEQAVCALCRALVVAFDFVVGAIDAPRGALHEATVSVASVDVRVFESTFWFVEELGETVLTSASWLAGSTAAALAFVFALPWNTLVWIESLVELIFVGAAGALHGVYRAVACHASTACSWTLSGIGAVTKAASTWSSADDWLSRLVACAAVLLLIGMAVAKTYQVARDQASDSHSMSEGSGERSRNNGYRTATNGGGSAAAPPHSHGAGSNTTCQDRPTRASEGRRHDSQHSHQQRQAADEASAAAAGRDDADLGAYLRQLQEQLDAEKEKQLCSVCQQTPKSVLLLPCRHLCVCPACSSQLTARSWSRERVCPLCRCAIDSTVSVYT